MMKGLIAIIAIKFIIVTAKCPDPELIAPCVCYHNTSDVRCTGNMTELPLNKLDPAFPWNGLYIHHTNLTAIQNSSLADTTWDGIYIYNNSILRTLESDAFKSGPRITLLIANNTNIRNADVFAVVKRLKNTERIFLESNEINTMPSFMFNEESRVKQLRFNHNTVRKLHSNTFTGAKYLEVVQLDHNNITAIDPNGLDFTAGGEGVRNVTVILDDNHLSTNSFTESTFKVSDKIIRIILSLKSNDLKNISREVFEPFFANGLNEINVDNNDFKCDCSFKWLFEKSIESRVFSIDCVNKHSSLYRMSVADLCGEEITTTLSTPTEIPTTTTTTPTPTTLEETTTDLQFETTTETPSTPTATFPSITTIEYTTLTISTTTPTTPTTTPPPTTILTDTTATPPTTVVNDTTATPPTTQASTQL